MLAPDDGESACLRCEAEERGTLSTTRARSEAEAEAERPSWQDCQGAARIALTEHAVLELLRQHFADADSIFVHPYIPQTKELAARLAYVAHLPVREPVLALYDTNVLDASVHEGFVVTSSRVCWKNPGEPACSVQWRDLDPDRLYLDGQRLFVGDEAIALTEPEVQDACANAFHVLAISGLPPHALASGHVLAGDARREHDASDGDRSGGRPSLRRSATPPPPHTTSYFAYASHAQLQAPDCSCWHCHTPLYATTPQCSFCGAEPKPTGWLRTA